MQSSTDKNEEKDIVSFKTKDSIVTVEVYNYIDDFPPNGSDSSTDETPVGHCQDADQQGVTAIEMIKSLTGTRACQNSPRASTNPIQNWCQKRENIDQHISCIPTIVGNGTPGQSRSIRLIVMREINAAEASHSCLSTVKDHFRNVLDYRTYCWAD